MIKRAHIMRRLLAATVALVAVLNAGCIVLDKGEGPFHSDRGDLVSKDGAVRYVGWCELHPHNSSCMTPSTGPAVALAEP